MRTEVHLVQVQRYRFNQERLLTGTAYCLLTIRLVYTVGAAGQACEGAKGRKGRTAGRKASKCVAGGSMTYDRRYPVCTEEPTRREGATGPERPKRMRPDGAVCYV